LNFFSPPALHGPTFHTKGQALSCFPFPFTHPGLSFLLSELSSQQYQRLALLRHLLLQLFADWTRFSPTLMFPVFVSPVFSSVSLCVLSFTPLTHVPSFSFFWTPWSMVNFQSFHSTFSFIVYLPRPPPVVTPTPFCQDVPGLTHLGDILGPFTKVSYTHRVVVNPSYSPH